MTPIYLNIPTYISYIDHSKGIAHGVVNYNDKLELITDPLDDTVIAAYRDAHISRMKIILAGSRKVFTYHKIVHIVNEVLAKNSKLKTLYKDAKGYLKPDAEECTQRLIYFHLQALPELLNNRKKLTEVLMMEKLL